VKGGKGVHYTLLCLDCDTETPLHIFFEYVMTSDVMDKWEKLGGGMARIHVFDSRLNAGSYILKRNGFKLSAVDLGDAYESAKCASKTCELMLADRVWKVAGWRSEYERARLAPTK
jgi:hypothetical protein